jgi:hypothetical protein
MTYLVYHVSDYNEGKNLPIAAGSTEEDARALGIRTVLGLGWTDGTLNIVRNDALSENDAKCINDAVAEFLNIQKS